MLKYIADILAQFTKTQKILALLMLLMTITIVALAPSYISAVTTDRAELESKIESQSKKIKNLEDLTDQLDTRIREDQRKCTDAIVERENEFMSMLESIKIDLKAKEKEMKPSAALDNFIISSTPVESDTAFAYSVLKTIRTIDKPIPRTTNLNTVVAKIEYMQKSIKKSK